ncbi:MAG: YfcE family phosphodiesterase [Fusobacteriaceae bacterium]
MKILVYSDSHGEISNIVEIYEKEKPDFIISAGDYSEDFRDFKLSYKDINIKSKVVKGNCDYFDKTYEEEEIFEIKGRRFFLTHGHLYGVKGSLNQLKIRGVETEADFVIFGHTHIPFHQRYKRCEYFNPGALKDKKYGIIEIEGENVNFFLKSLP